MGLIITLLKFIWSFVLRICYLEQMIEPRLPARLHMQFSIFNLQLLHYTVDMYYIVGLGNPGEQYEHTPHNMGRELVSELVARRYGRDASWDSAKQAAVYAGEIEGTAVQYILPNTFMNRSGEALRSCNPEAESVIVIYDDISLPFGEIRLSKNRGDGGHNGIKSIEQSLKSRSFIRFRVGVAPKDILGRIRIPPSGSARTNYLVGKKMSPSKRKQYADLARRIDTYIALIITKGYEYAASKQADL